MKKNTVQVEPEEGLKFEDVLIRNGYIAEDYLDYISLFHDGDISRTDYQFMLKLKNCADHGRLFDFSLSGLILCPLHDAGIIVFPVTEAIP